MTLLKTTLVAALMTASALPALAQDAHAGHGAEAGAVLPEICMTGDMASDMPMSMEHGEMDEAHTDLMAGMAETNSQMMSAMMVEDIDVAFVCGMIPHHQAAINMAKAELAHGDNQWAKEMAQKIIDAQEQEIAEMTAWLEGEGASE